MFSAARKGPGVCVATFALVITSALTADARCQHTNGKAFECDCGRKPGDVPLTKELWEKHTTAELQAVTCIPREEFKNFGGPLKFTGLKNLREVELKAFLGAPFVSFTGSYPNLMIIGTAAFYRAGGRKQTQVDLSNAPMLKLLDDWAFYQYRGKIVLEGDFFDLVQVGIGTFFEGGSNDSIIDFTEAPSLQKMMNQAFYRYTGTVKVGGAMPAFDEIGGNCFAEASNRDNRIAIECVSTGGLSISGDSFKDFRGRRDKKGEKRTCSSNQHLNTARKSEL